jgi:hypothetical protein
VAAIFFVSFIALVNFAIGFGLAVHLGHGPSWAELPSPNEIRRMIRSGLRRRAKAARS